MNAAPICASLTLAFLLGGLAGYHMQNYRLLKELGQLNRPVILRRGTANTVDELVSRLEHALAEPGPHLIDAILPARL